MEIVILENPEEVCKYGAQVIARRIKKKPGAVLGLAAGTTQAGMYRELAMMHKKEGLDLSKVSTFNLDKYVGLEPDHQASYHSIMQRYLFAHVNIPRKNIHIPNGISLDIPGECDLYEKKMQELGGLDLCLLGLGRDGHIGFNEPSSSLSSRTRLKSLTEKTRYDRAPLFSSIERVPRHVITMGVGTIMDAHEVMLLAFGEKKKEIIAKVVEGPITAMVPASVLQYHERAKVVLDEAAAGLLTMKEYYRWAFKNKPKWQGM